VRSIAGYFLIECRPSVYTEKESNKIVMLSHDAYIGNFLKTQNSLSGNYIVLLRIFRRTSVIALSQFTRFIVTNFIKLTTVYSLTENLKKKKTHQISPTHDSC